MKTHSVFCVVRCVLRAKHTPKFSVFCVVFCAKHNAKHQRDTPCCVLCFAPLKGCAKHKTQRLRRARARGEKNHPGRNGGLLRTTDGYPRWLKNAPRWRRSRFPRRVGSQADPAPTRPLWAKFTRPKKTADRDLAVEVFSVFCATSRFGRKTQNPTPFATGNPEEDAKHPTWQLGPMGPRHQMVPSGEEKMVIAWEGVKRCLFLSASSKHS